MRGIDALSMFKRRDWQKIGDVSELAQVEPAVAEVVASWHQKI